MSTMPPPPGGFQSAPQYQGGQGGGGPVMTQPPRSIVNAKYAMWAGAVLQIIALPLSLLLQDQMRDAAEKSLRDSGAEYDSSAVDTAVMIGIGLGVVMAVVGAALWVLMAYLNGKGYGWARIVATVLYGIFILSFLAGFAQPTPALTMALNVVVLIVGGAATFFLWQKDSTAWFQARKAPTV